MRAGPPGLSTLLLNLDADRRVKIENDEGLAAKCPMLNAGAQITPIRACDAITYERPCPPPSFVNGIRGVRARRGPRPVIRRRVAWSSIYVR